MKVHNIKIFPLFYERLKFGDKTCELRKNDRDYQVGDEICFNVQAIENPAPSEYFGWQNNSIYTITHVLQGFKGLEEGYCILSLEYKGEPS